ncbi:hypothetical protein [Gorillibacterium sp. sgz5001074]|uniref:hypothetical protein n=1 Tax=Gorillibacterium sp. sgz5001074 TaxID=3446695 RepID=UPI003F669D52
MNYKRNKRYFKTTRLKPGIILILFGLFTFVGFRVAGLLIVVAGIAHIYFQVRGKPTDAEIDAICKNEINDAVKNGLSKIGIDEEQVQLIEPIIIDGPYFDNIAREYLWKQGKDGLFRSSNYEVAVLFFSESQVYCYTYRFSLVDNERNENTDEYFYKDVVAVSTSSDKITMKNTKGKDEFINLEHFMLTTVAGTSISCSVSDIGGIERSIQGMKQLLREKKGA